MSQEITIGHSQYFTQLANNFVQLVKNNKNGIIILGGGNSPKQLNLEITKILERDQELKSHFFKNFTVYLSDERYVPINHETSNFRMLKKTLFHSATNLIPFKTELSIEDCAKNYQETISKDLESKKIILSLLGVGPDGHTAGLFPNQLNGNMKFIEYGAIGPEGSKRISFSHELFLKSDHIWFLTNGDAKKDAFIKSKTQTDDKMFPLLPFIKNEKSTFYFIKDEN